MHSFCNPNKIEAFRHSQRFSLRQFATYNVELERRYVGLVSAEVSQKKSLCSLTRHTVFLSLRNSQPEEILDGPPQSLDSKSKYT